MFSWLLSANRHQPDITVLSPGRGIAVSGGICQTEIGLVRNFTIGDVTVTVREFFRTATQWCVIRRSLVIAAIVGTVLAVVNHGSCAAGGAFTSTCALKSAITVVVPYCVSTVSCVLSHRDHARTVHNAESAVSLDAESDGSRST